MTDPLGYLITWTTYGTWMRGDDRGWVDRRRATPGTPFEAPDAARRVKNLARMTESPVILEPLAREVVEAALGETCRIKGWDLHAQSVRSNHVHVVVAAPSVPPERVAKILKEHGTKALNGLYPGVKRRHWWTKGESKRYLNDERSLLAAIRYVRNQDRKGRDG